MATSPQLLKTASTLKKISLLTLPYIFGNKSKI